MPLLTVLREHHPAVLTVDLAGVTFLDCASIRALVAAYHAAVRGGCQMWVTRPRPLSANTGALVPTAPSTRIAACRVV